MNSIESQLTYFYIVCVCELTYLILMHYDHTYYYSYWKQPVYDEPEVTLHAACSIHELFLLRNQISFKSSYHNFASLFLEHRLKKTGSVINRFQYKRDICNFCIPDIMIFFFKLVIYINKIVGTSGGLRHKQGIRDIPCSIFRYLPVCTFRF